MPALTTTTAPPPCPCSTALALLANDINASVALCGELLGSSCCAAASVVSATEDAAAGKHKHQYVTCI
jgi:hypothetical protein